MADKDNKNEDKLFRETMDALGVQKSHTSVSDNIKKTIKKTVVIKKRGQSNQPSQINSSWPIILYKDLEPEAQINTQGLSAQLTANSILFHRGSLSQKNIKRLQRGQYNIASSLDLHGLTVDEAIQALNDYINHYKTDNKTCCLIIHGKGYHSKESSPKLKSLTERWLKAHPRIIAYCSAQAKDGGTGAVYILLKN